MPSLRFIFGVVNVFRYGTGVGGAITSTLAAATEMAKVCEVEPVALVPVTVKTILPDVEVGVPVIRPDTELKLNPGIVPMLGLTEYEATVPPEEVRL